MAKRIINRHKNCGGFIIPDINNSSLGTYFGYCTKCGKEKLSSNDHYDVEENIILYCIRNKSTGKHLLLKGTLSTITFETKEQAENFATTNKIDNYVVEEL